LRISWRALPSAAKEANSWSARLSENVKDQRKIGRATNGSLVVVIIMIMIMIINNNKNTATFRPFGLFRSSD
jgi:hypothetical protein